MWWTNSVIWNSKLNRKEQTWRLVLAYTKTLWVTSFGSLGLRVPGSIWWRMRHRPKIDQRRRINRVSMTTSIPPSSSIPTRRWPWTNKGKGNAYMYMLMSTYVGSKESLARIKFITVWCDNCQDSLLRLFYDENGWKRSFDRSWWRKMSHLEYKIGTWVTQSKNGDLI